MDCATLTSNKKQIEDYLKNGERASPTSRSLAIAIPSMSSRISCRRELLPSELRETALGISSFRYWTAYYFSIASHRFTISIADAFSSEATAAGKVRRYGRLAN